MYIIYLCLRILFIYVYYIFMYIIYIYIYQDSRLTVVSREAKEEVPCEGLSTKDVSNLQEQT